MKRVLPWLYLIAAFAFIYLPVGTLVLFSFQNSTLPVPPFDGPSLRWYGEVLAEEYLIEALTNSLLVALLSSSVAVSVPRLNPLVVSVFSSTAKLLGAMSVGDSFRSLTLTVKVSS